MATMVSNQQDLSEHPATAPAAEEFNGLSECDDDDGMPPLIISVARAHDQSLRTSLRCCRSASSAREWQCAPIACSMKRAWCRSRAGKLQEEVDTSSADDSSPTESGSLASSSAGGKGGRMAGPPVHAVTPSQPWPHGYRKRFRAIYDRLNWVWRQQEGGCIDQALLLAEVEKIGQAESGLECSDCAGLEELGGHVAQLRIQFGFRVHCGRTGKLLSPP